MYTQHLITIYQPSFKCAFPNQTFPKIVQNISEKSDRNFLLVF